MDDVLTDTVETCLSLVKKIIDEIPRLHQSYIQVDTMTLGPNVDLSRWDCMSRTLKIPTAPNPILPSSSTAETFSQILVGLQPYKTTLETIKDHLSNPGPMKYLLADLEELLVQISMALKHVDVSPLPESAQPSAMTQLSDYDVQVTTHVTLVRLQHFGQEVFRFLRSLTARVRDQMEKEQR